MSESTQVITVQQFLTMTSNNGLKFSDRAGFILGIIGVILGLWYSFTTALESPDSVILGLILVIVSLNLIYLITEV